MEDAGGNSPRPGTQPGPPMDIPIYPRLNPLTKHLCEKVQPTAMDIEEAMGHIDVQLSALSPEDPSVEEAKQDLAEERGILMEDYNKIMEYEAISNKARALDHSAKAADKITVTHQRHRLRAKTAARLSRVTTEEDCAAEQTPVNDKPEAGSSVQQSVELCDTAQWNLSDTDESLADRAHTVDGPGAGRSSVRQPTDCSRLSVQPCGSYDETADEDEHARNGLNSRPDGPTGNNSTIGGIDNTRIQSDLE